MNTEYHIAIAEIILEFSKITLHGYMAREKIPWVLRIGMLRPGLYMIKETKTHQDKAVGVFFSKENRVNK